MLLTGLYAVVGVPRPLAVVGSVQAGSAAEAVGLEPGDRIVHVGGEDTHWFADLRRIVAANPDTALDIRFLRGDSEMDVVARIGSVEREGGRIGSLGVVADGTQIEYERQNPLSAGVAALDMSLGMGWRILSYVGQVVVGARPAEEIGGPLRIAQMSGEVAGRRRGRPDLLHGRAVGQSGVDQSVPGPDAGRWASGLFLPSRPCAAAHWARGLKNTVSVSD